MMFYPQSLSVIKKLPVLGFSVLLVIVLALPSFAADKSQSSILGGFAEPRGIVGCRSRRAFDQERHQCGNYLYARRDRNLGGG